MQRTSKRLLASLVGLVIVALGFGALAALDRSSELEAIEAAAGDYLEGGTTGDIARLRSAFHPSTVLKFVKDGSYGEWPVDAYLGRMTPGKRSERRTRILLVDFAGTCALVKAEVDYGSFRFIDYLSLLKVDGRWRIVGKIFYRDTSQPRTSEQTRQE
jgi:protease I